MGKWNYRDEGKKISQALLREKSTEDLRISQNFINGLLELRKSQKLEKTYIKGTANAIAYNESPKVYVDFRFDGTVTGRLSCAAYSAKKAMGVSFHTLPRDTKNNIRSLFIAPKGYKFITVDYAAMELRVLAHIAQEGNMQTAFNNGEDLHTYTARMLFNKQNISKGDIFSSENIGVRRTLPGKNGSEPKYFDSVLGLIAKKDFNVNEPITIEEIN